MSDIKIKLAAGTNVGLIRTNNEDNFVASRDLTVSDWTIPQVDETIDLGQYGALLVVADGMGGANAGEVASAIAIETVQLAFTADRLEEAVKTEEATLQFMVDTVKSADLNILNRSKEDSSTQGMGTTIVLAWILNQHAYVCWCGDSRCYVFNPNLGLTRLSKDHSYVQELVDKGELTEENAHDHPYSNVITRCLGDTQNRAVPDTRIHQLRNGDIFLLCSDGLCGLCRDGEIMDVISEHKDDVNECKNELISAALNAGGYDNVTVVLGAVAMDESQEKNEDDENAATSDMGRTIPAKTRHRHTLLKVVLGLLLLLIVFGVYAYFFNQPLYDRIVAYVSTLLVRFKS
jgi:protein phosphatase